MNSTYVLKIFIVDDDVFFGNAVKKRLEKQENVEVTFFQHASDFIHNLYHNPLSHTR